MKVAIVHDWLPYVGGAEYVLKSMLEIFPDAILYTSIYNRKKMGDFFKGVEIRTSFIDRLPFGKTRHSAYLGLMPYAFEQFDLRNFDVVISSSTSCAKGVITDARTLHICYCNTPMRYAWDFYFDYLYKDSNIIKTGLIHLLMHRIRMWDVLTADRVDHFIANSDNVARRIKKHYRRESQVIYPPVVLPPESDAAPSRGDYYLVLSRLVSYKRIDLAVEAFNKLGVPLVVVGEGPEEKRLKKAAGSNIRFVGRVTEDEKADWFKNCRGFIFPGEEDFGITPVEAQGYGKPVVAYGRGGACETVINGFSGVFFEEQTSDSLAEAVIRAEGTDFDPAFIAKHARNFSDSVFKERLRNFVVEKYEQFIKENK